MQYRALLIKVPVSQLSVVHPAFYFSEIISRNEHFLELNYVILFLEKKVTAIRKVAISHNGRSQIPETTKHIQLKVMIRVLIPLFSLTNFTIMRVALEAVQ